MPLQDLVKFNMPCRGYTSREVIFPILWILIIKSILLDLHNNVLKTMAYA